jgi:Tubulin-tyrosine ligase family
MSRGVAFMEHIATTGPRPTIALIETGACQLAVPPRGVNPVLLRVGGLFSRAARVVMCAWHQVDLTTDAATITGPVLRVDGNKQTLESLEGTLPVDAMWFYPVADPTPFVIGASEPERAALARVVSLGGRPARSRSGIAAHLLFEAARRGVVTNSPGPLGRWGRKDHLEYALRWYARASGRRLPRPRTLPVSGAQVRGALDHFAQRGAACILKPANQARGEGVRVVPATTLAYPDVAYDEQFIVQELVTRPLLIDGFKSDLRVYVLVDSADRSCSRRLSPILVRTASAPHGHAGDLAEITNVSYRRRLGFSAGIAPLDACPGVAEDDARSITAGVDTLTGELLNAIHAWSATHDQARNCEVGGRRVMIWGLDIVLTGPFGSRLPLLLEVNVYPQLYRGDATCDALIDGMLLNDYLPVFGRPVHTGTWPASGGRP